MAKSSTVELGERIDRVEEMLCAGIDPGRVERTIAKEYGVSTRQARNYLGKAYARWQSQTNEDAPHRREKVIRMTERFYARALSEKQYTAASSALGLLARMSGAFAQHDAEREKLLARLGPPPDDPTLVLVWAQRCMASALYEVVSNPSIDPERRLRWVAELGSKLGMTHAKALVGSKLEEVAERVFGSGETPGDELEPTDGLAWPDTSRARSRDSHRESPDRSGADPPPSKDE